MSKIKVRCVIENAEEKECIETKGIKKENTLSFYDDQHVKHAITLGENAVRYEKTGSIEMDFLFQEETVHSGHYRIKEGAFYFKIDTLYLSVTNGDIKVDYILKQEDLVVNTARMHVTYEEI